MYHSFMVRIWREAGRKPGEFYVTAESVQSGQTHQFEDLPSLLDFLQTHIDSDTQAATSEEQIAVDEADLDHS